MFATRDAVQLTRDLPEHGLRAGDLGTVVEASPAEDRYDVEFVRGETLLRVRLAAADLRPLEKGFPVSETAKQNFLALFLLNRFEEIFASLDRAKIAGQVDAMGIQAFLKQTASYATASGAATGAWGILGLLGVPLDLVNCIVQQFRATLAVIYHRTGRYEVTFDYFIGIVAASLGVSTSSGSAGRTALLQVARQIVVRLAAGSAGRLVPVVGALVAGGVNYVFLTTIGKQLMKLDIRLP